MAALEEQHKKYATAAADLLVDLLKYLRTPINVEEPWPTISPENLGVWIAAVVATPIVSTTPTPNPYWRALWKVPHENKEFDKEFDQLANALKSGVDGALQVRIEQAPLRRGGRGYAMVIEFCAKDRLETFLAALPEIKMQTKPLWVGETAPDEKSSSSIIPESV